MGSRLCARLAFLGGRGVLRSGSGGRLVAWAECGGELGVGLGQEGAKRGPHLSGSKLDRQIYRNLHDPLATLDDKLQIQPNLAEAWQAQDPKTLILKLRSGVKFHDGTEFNAE